MGFLSSIFGGNKMDRREFNARVSRIIEEEFGITPISTVDDRFPGVLVYLDMIDDVYYDSGSPERAALRVILPLAGGLYKSGIEKDRADAVAIFERARAIMPVYVKNGVLSEQMRKEMAQIVKRGTGYSI